METNDFPKVRTTNSLFQPAARGRNAFRVVYACDCCIRTARFRVLVSRSVNRADDICLMLCPAHLHAAERGEWSALAKAAKSYGNAWKTCFQGENDNEAA